ncbi:flavodoxin family protein [Clostridium grantii]|uniref:NADPH-dependent FMN reductase n=1 Tax=Clostridium grantii DSM 8605 TaxID=1121316 RepID=A0A1M5X6R7_9CLOT|nr:flavodoxin family protein [Clostridium grantii]SHH94913.1 NADPH-dependent FMN reductase [Clostridium grantii DSM 8605]
MKLLAVVGSSRKNGNTATLIKEALKPFEKEAFDIELIYLSDYQYKDCIGCEGCKDTFKCAIKDDMQKIYPKVMEADALIIGSPTYFYNMTADMKAFLDRLYCYEVFHEEDRSVWMGLNEAFGVKYAAVVAVCEQNDEKDMGYTAISMEKTLQALGYRVVDVVKALKLFSRKEAKNHEDTMIEAYNCGEKLLKTLKLREEVQKKIRFMEQL